MVIKLMDKINRRALFADETSDYRCPEEPDRGDRVLLSFRAAKDDAERVDYVAVTGAEEENGYAGIAMEKSVSDEMFDYYQREISVGSDVLLYYFRITKGADVCYYSRSGVTERVPCGSEFRITPGFHTPEWAKGAVMYQIFIDRFCNGDKSNDVQDCEYVYIGQPVSRVKDWDKTPSQLDVRYFYGGDLQGVWDKLDYLQYLGVEVIYFNPLFVSPSNHKYDTQDYDHIDPHVGVIVKDGGQNVSPRARTNAAASRYRMRSANPKNLEASDRFFACFMEEVHKRGMKVIMDGVFNHCGSFNKWLDREHLYKKMKGYAPGAYRTWDSPYRDFFHFENNAWPDNRSYESWWGNDTLPKLNYEGSGTLYEYILGIGRKWVSDPYNIDGWRLDVAADLGHSPEMNHQFWRDFRSEVKSANPDALILAEHYGDPKSWLEGDQWDTVMNYDAFMEPVTWFLTGMEKHSDEFRGDLLGDGAHFFESMCAQMGRMQTPSLTTAMNQLSNHDHSRFMTRTNQTVGRLATASAERAGEGINPAVYREAVMIQMTWPGAPTLYYGDETGVCGWTDPDNRRTFPWGRENVEMIEFHKYIIALHRHLPALRRGSIKFLTAGYQMIAYGRMRGKNCCVVVINNADYPQEIRVPVWELGIADRDLLRQVMLTTWDGYNAGGIEYYADQGMLTLTLPAYSGILLNKEA